MWKRLYTSVYKARAILHFLDGEAGGSSTGSENRTARALPDGVGLWKTLRLSTGFPQIIHRRFWGGI